MELFNIPGYPNYTVTVDGRVFGPRKELKQRITNGYAWVVPVVNGKHVGLRINRAVALALIPNPENKPEVNHKDKNKLNNHVSNLEWMTRTENQVHAQGQPVVMCDKAGNEINRFESMRAANLAGWCRTRIKEAIRDDYPYRGFIGG